MENLLEIVLFIIFSLVTTICSSLILYYLAILFNKTNYPKKKLLLSSIILLPFCILNNYIMINLQNIKSIVPLIAVLACTLIILTMYKCKLSKFLLMLLTYSFTTIMMDMILAFIVLLTGNEVTIITSNPKLHCIFGIFPNIIAASSIYFLNKLSKKKNLNNIFKDNYKYIIYQAVTIAVCLIPSMYMMFSNLYNYSGFPSGAAPVGWGLGGTTTGGAAGVSGIGSLISGIGSMSGTATGGASSVGGIADVASAVAYGVGKANGYGLGFQNIVMPLAGIVSGWGGIMTAAAPYLVEYGLPAVVMGNLMQGTTSAAVAAYQNVSGRIQSNADAILTNKVKNIETVCKMLDTQGDVIKKMIKDSIEGDSKSVQNM